MKLFYSPEYVAAGHSLETTRKAGWIADSLAADPISGVELVEPRPLTADEFSRLHTPEYVQAVQAGFPRSLAESQGFEWDKGLWTSVCASNGGAVAAALAAMQDGVAGSLSSGLHHAHHGHGSGFCTFNGLALAAKAALAAGAERVLVLDLDAHCGGGTAELLADDDRVWLTDLSLSDFDRWTPTSDRHRLTLLNSPRTYLSEISAALERLAHTRFDLVLYNAGMDPYDHGVGPELLAERERLVFGWCRARRTPIAFVLAGGYLGGRLDRDGLVRLHRLTLTAGRRNRKCVSPGSSPRRLPIVPAAATACGIRVWAQPIALGTSGDDNLVAVLMQNAFNQVPVERLLSQCGTFPHFRVLRHRGKRNRVRSMVPVDHEDSEPQVQFPLLGG